MTFNFRCSFTLFAFATTSILATSCVRAQPPQIAPDVIASIAKTYPLAPPPIVATLQSAKRGNVFFLGEEISFSFDKPAVRYEVRDYRGQIVDGGALRTSSTRFAVKAQPLGWYKLYLFGDRDQGEMYGKAIGGTTFVVFRRTAGFPALPAKEVPGGALGSEDEPMRGVIGMGPQRLVADAEKLEETIKNLEQDIALDKTYYLPFDPVRKRVLLVAFSNGTKKLDNVRKIVEHFKNDVTYWEPRNEPNYGASGRDFAINELKPFYETVKSVDKKLKVLGPGTVSINEGMMPWLDEFFTAGGAQYLDAFSFHAYNNINGDAFLGRKSLDTLMALLKKYKLQNIEKWQTEQGNLAALYKVYQPAHQARWTMLQMMLFEQYGIPKEHNHLWYDRSHGFWGVPSWWLNEDGTAKDKNGGNYTLTSLNPEAATMRVWSEELYGTRFHRVLDFGVTGNNLYLGAEFRSPDTKNANAKNANAKNANAKNPKTIFSMMSVGDTKGQVELSVLGGKTLRVISAWGEAKNLPVKNNRVLVDVPELPIYVEAARDQIVTVIPTDWGANLARGAKLAISTKAEKLDAAKIVNGEVEAAWNADSDAWRVYNPQMPFTLELSWPQSQNVARMIVWAQAPWQYQSTMLDYDVQAQIGGAWKTVATIREPTGDVLAWTPPTRTVIDIFHSDRLVFQSRFAPIKTDKIRLLIRKVSNGGGLIPLVDSIKGGQAWNVPIVTLREVQVFGK